MCLNYPKVSVVTASTSLGVTSVCHVTGFGGRRLFSVLIGINKAVKNKGYRGS